MGTIIQILTIVGCAGFIIWYLHKKFIQLEKKFELYLKPSDPKIAKTVLPVSSAAEARAKLHKEVTDIIQSYAPTFIKPKDIRLFAINPDQDPLQLNSFFLHPHTKDDNIIVGNGMDASHNLVRPGECVNLAGKVYGFLGQDLNKREYLLLADNLEVIRITSETTMLTVGNYFLPQFLQEHS